MAGIDKIRVSVEALEGAIGKFERCKGELASAYGIMATEVMALGSSWNGAASEAFADRFSELTANIKTSDGTIDQAVQGLKTAAQIYTEVQDEVSGMFAGMTDASPFKG